MLRNHYCTVCWLASWLDNWLVDCNMYDWLVGTLAVRAAFRVERHLVSYEDLSYQTTAR